MDCGQGAVRSEPVAQATHPPARAPRSGIASGPKPCACEPVRPAIVATGFGAGRVRGRALAACRAGTVPTLELAEVVGVPNHTALGVYGRPAHAGWRLHAAGPESASLW